MLSFGFNQQQQQPAGANKFFYLFDYFSLSLTQSLAFFMDFERSIRQKNNKIKKYTSNASMTGNNIFIFFFKYKKKF